MDLLKRLGIRPIFETLLTLLSLLIFFSAAAFAAVTPKVAAGTSNTMVLKSDGTVFAWGWNLYGQLGDGTTTDRHSPTVVPGLTGVTAIVPGYAHTAARKSDGTVLAWGNNLHGQIGDGTTTERHSPTVVPGLTGMAAIAVGDAHTVALKNAGTVLAWGSNLRGQLGDGTTTDRHSPTVVPGLTGVTAIAAGYQHTVALKSDGTVVAWGWNVNGQLGDGTTTEKHSPTVVPGLTGVTAIATGYNHTVALKSDGTVVAWGENQNGQLGDGTTIERHSPIVVPGLNGVAAIAVGQYHTVVLKNDGTLVAWGWNGSGQLGDGTTTQRTSPTVMSGVTGVTAIAVGQYHTVLLKNDGTVVAWGRNGSGEVGDGTTTQRTSPTIVPGLNLGASIFTITTGVTGNGSITCTPSATVSLNGSTTCTATPDAGNYVASVTVDGTVQSAAANTASYSQPFTSVTANHTMTAIFSVQNNQTITFNPATKTYGDPPFNLGTLVSSGGSGNPVTFTLISGPGSLSGTNNATLTITGAGSIVLRASQAGSAAYIAAADVVQTITVNKATATIILGDLTATHDGTAKSATATTIPAGLAVTITYTYDGSIVIPTNCGSYTVVAAINDANYQGTASGTLVIKDTTPPVIHMSTLPDGSYTNNEMLNITGTVTDDVGVKYLTVNGVVLPVNSDGSFSLAMILVDGPNQITALASDSAGNKSTDSRTIILDVTAPNLLITAPADNSKTATALATISGTVDEASTVAVKVGNDIVNATMNGTSYTASVTLVAGINTIEVTATDLAGNTNTLKRTVIYDDQSPDLAITAPSQDSRTNQANLTIRGTVSDPYTAVTVSIAMDGQTYTPAVINGQFEQAVTFTTEKSYAIVVTATNEAGVSSTIQRNVLYDATKPGLTIDPVTSPTGQASVVLTGTRETGTIVSLSVDTAAVIGQMTYPDATTWSCAVSSLATGTNTITVTGQDQAGNTTSVTAQVVYQ
ncbi:hypothetical protein F6V30_02190 [Oryzomonas sagensis]|uniref:Alpha-tubulin suppressor-like RCC1 family protein n=1 Tax=Oryzomonas sagensis TaxID=2603857 RepID=A0ABQ6TRS5_9BACT|nr:MBG domain-containing protein [Oryzomonas sagensis]KAB0671412.1 hypothetical protein F6V30_02190 [Oryzomonas sagensis]